MKILIIDDIPVSYEINEILKSLKTYNSTAIIFEPKSLERKELYEELRLLCEKEKFDFALLDYELWGGGEFCGDELVPILKAANIDFFAFSGRASFNSILEQKGAMRSILKDKNIKGDQVVSKMLSFIS